MIYLLTLTSSQREITERLKKKVSQVSFSLNKIKWFFFAKEISKTNLARGRFNLIYLKWMIFCWFFPFSVENTKLRRFLILFSLSFVDGTRVNVNKKMKICIFIRFLRFSYRCEDLDMIRDEIFTTQFYTSHLWKKSNGNYSNHSIFHTFTQMFCVTGSFVIGKKFWEVENFRMNLKNDCAIWNLYTESLMRILNNHLHFLWLSSENYFRIWIKWSCENETRNHQTEDSSVNFYTLTFLIFLLWIIFSLSCDCDCIIFSHFLSF